MLKNERLTTKTRSPQSSTMRNIPFAWCALGELDGSVVCTFSFADRPFYSTLFGS